MSVQRKKVALMSQMTEMFSFKNGGLYLSLKKNTAAPTKRMNIWIIELFMKVSQITKTSKIPKSKRFKSPSFFELQEFEVIELSKKSSTATAAKARKRIKIKEFTAKIRRCVPCQHATSEKI